ncbi:WD40-repeat-containing domain protein, partial [Baffinella frigidus]
GVVKCVRFQSTPGDADARTDVFASAGNDRNLRISDARVKGAGVVKLFEDASDTSVNFVKLFEDASDTCVNFVQWSPADSNILFSAGFDRAICLWDIRSTSDKPLHRLEGHHRTPGGGKIKGMHRAAFLASGRFVITTGEKTKLISIYDVATGKTVSRGESDDGGTAVVVLEGGGSCVLAVGGSCSTVSLFTPLPA